MGDLVKKNTDLLPLNMKEVEERISVIRNQEVIADADVAFLYGVVPPRHSRSAVYTCWLADGTKRNILKQLKDSGASHRQLERLTGVGRGLIQKL